MNRYLASPPLVLVFLLAGAGCSSSAAIATDAGSRQLSDSAVNTTQLPESGASDGAMGSAPPRDGGAAEASAADATNGADGKADTGVDASRSDAAVDAAPRDDGGADSAMEATVPSDGGCTPAASLTYQNGIPLGCAAKPSACCYPDETNTGVPAGTTLTPMTGGIEVNTDGTVISGVDISGSLDIYASNVTIKNSRITVSSSGSFAVAIRTGSAGVTIQDSVIRGQDNDMNSVEYAVANLGSATDIRLERVELYNCSECVIGANVTLTDSYIHDTADPPGAHVENIYGLTNTSYIHNTMFNPVGQTAVVYLDPSFGGTAPSDCHCTVSNNLLAGGGYTIYGGGYSTVTATDVSITNNRFSKMYYPMSGYYGIDAYFDEGGAGNVWSGNLWDDTAAIISAE